MSVLCENSCELNLHDILLEANDQIHNKEQFKNQFGFKWKKRKVEKDGFQNNDNQRQYSFLN